MLALAKPNASEFVMQVVEWNQIVDEEELGEVAKAMKLFMGFCERHEGWGGTTKLRQAIYSKFT